MRAESALRTMRGHRKVWAEKCSALPRGELDRSGYCCSVFCRCAHGAMAFLTAWCVQLLNPFFFNDNHELGRFAKLATTSVKPEGG